jgi:hypothetical protein
MTYVPVTPATSQNAQRLADELKRVIEEHKRAHPGLSGADIQQALRLAGTATGAQTPRRLILVGVWALLFALGLLAFWLFRAG